MFGCGSKFLSPNQGINSRMSDENTPPHFCSRGAAGDHQDGDYKFLTEVQNEKFKSYDEKFEFIFETVADLEKRLTQETEERKKEVEEIQKTQSSIPEKLDEIAQGFLQTISEMKRDIMSNRPPVNNEMPPSPHGNPNTRHGPRDPGASGRVGRVHKGERVKCPLCLKDLSSTYIRKHIRVFCRVVRNAQVS